MTQTCSSPRVKLWTLSDRPCTFGLGGWVQNSTPAACGYCCAMAMADDVTEIVASRVALASKSTRRVCSTSRQAVSSGAIDASASQRITLIPNSPVARDEYRQIVHPVVTF